MTSRTIGAVAALCLLAWAGAAEAGIRMFSYDPANAETRHAAGALTFQFRQRLMFTTLMNLRSTVGQATAYLEPVDDGVLGKGGVSGLIGEGALERDLYEVKPDADGEALVAALCPGGARRGFMSFGRLRANRPLRVHVLAVDAAGTPRLCRTLDFTFHGEWPMAKDVPRTTDRDVKRPRFPY